MSETAAPTPSGAIFGATPPSRMSLTQRRWLTFGLSGRPPTPRMRGASARRSFLLSVARHAIRSASSTDLWQWSNRELIGYWPLEKTRDMLKRDSGTEPTVITICDYYEIQPKTDGKRDSKRDTARDTGGQDGTRTGTN